MPKTAISKTQLDDKSGHRLEPAALRGQASELAGVIELAGGMVGANGNGNVEPQATRLSDSRFQAVQRQTMAKQVGQVQGNQHLQRVVASLESHKAPALQHAQRSRSLPQGAVTLIEAAALSPDQKSQAYELLSMANKSNAIRSAVSEPNEESKHEVRAYRMGYERAFDKLSIQRQPSDPAVTGNAGTAPASPVRAQTQTTLPKLEQAARDLTLWFAMPYPAAHTEQIFRTILLLKGQGEALQAAFRQNAGRDLLTAIDEGLSDYDRIRARSYLKYGTLRLADKIYFAVEGAGTDEDTLYRLLPQVKANLAQVDTDFAADYGEDFSEDGNLPNGQMSRIAGVLEDQLSDWELDKAKALLVYGELRPVDEIRIATNRWGTDEDMLLEALEKSDKNTVRQDYQASYGESLDEVIDSELSGDAQERAELTLAGKYTAFEKIRIAVEGWGTDEPAIFDAINKADPTERAQLAADFKNEDSDFFEILDDDLDEDDMKRVEALLVQSEQDTALQKLQQAGALDGSDLVDEIKLSSGAKYQKYKNEYNTPGSEFYRYVQENTDSDDRSDLEIILYGNVEARLDWAVAGAGTDEDYIFHVLQHFTDDASKRSLAENKTVMDDLDSDLSTSDFNRVKDLLTPSNLSLEQKVADTGERMEREGSWITDLTSNTSDALADENRELVAALDRARADGEISPEEQAEIAKFQKETDASLEVYKKVRDEIEGTMATILSTAAAIVVGVLSAGTLSGLSAAMIASQLAQAALVSAIAKVAAMKVAKGDRFDVFGADGALAFGTGTIDGVMNVVGAGAASKLVGPLFKTVAVNAAEQGAVTGFKTVGRELLTKAMEGSITSSSSAVFEAAANESTWKNGFVDGMTSLAVTSGISITTGAVAGSGFHAGAKGYSAISERLSGAAGHGLEQSLEHEASQAGQQALGYEAAQAGEVAAGTTHIEPAVEMPGKPVNAAEPAANSGGSGTTGGSGAPPSKVGPAANIPEHAGAFPERGVFNKTTKTTYIVRAGPPGSYGDHLFASLEEAQAYARQLASTGEAAIRETSALSRVWKDGAEGNPVDAIRVFEVPPDTPYIQGVVGPQMEGGTVHGSPVTYQGGGPQVVLDRKVRLGEPVVEVPVTEPTPVGRTSGPEPGTTPTEPTATGSPEPRATHYDEPKVEEGIVAKEQTSDGMHEIKVTEDGRIIRCSTCGELRVELDNLEMEFPDNHELTEELKKLREGLEAAEFLKDANAKAAEAKRIEEQLTDLRRSAEVAEEFGEAQQWGSPLEDTQGVSGTTRPRTAMTDRPSELLAENMKKARMGELPPGHDAHHIVAWNDPRAEVARDILAEASIGINDAQNGIYLPKTSENTIVEAFERHQTIHTDKYYEELTQRLSKAAKTRNVSNELARIGAEIANGDFPH
jgi:hypothetical protein